ncbi:MAG: hypothetical protein Q4B03_08950 [Lachnospiraceae bacterium]|nr:hypothetical protein [Lachnospiraceae bacterium]
MLIFFDFDGTLSAPRFPAPDSSRAEFVCGLTEDGWKNYYEEKKEHTFDYCLPVGPVRRYAMKKKKEGHRLFVLTRTASEREDAGKEAFLEKHYQGIFERYLSVRHDSEKIPVIRSMAETLGVPDNQCELVEDTYMLVLQALSEGMIGTHVSNIVAEEEGDVCSGKSDSSAVI